MVPQFGSFSAFIEEFVLPLRTSNPEWRTLHGNGASSRRAAARFVHGGELYKVDEDSQIASLIAPYQAKRGPDDAAVLRTAATEVRNRTMKSGEIKCVGGNPKLVPAPGCGSSAHFFVYQVKARRS